MLFSVDKTLMGNFWLTWDIDVKRVCFFLKFFFKAENHYKNI